MKIRVRLSLWYFFITLAILLAFNLGTYLAMKHLLTKALDDELHVITASLEVNYNPRNNSFSNLEMETYNLNRHLKKFYLIVYNVNKEPIFKSRLATMVSFNIPPVENNVERNFTISKKAADIPIFETNGHLGHDDVVMFRAISRKLFYQNQLIGWASLAMPVEDIEESMGNLLEILIGGSIFAVFLLGVGSYFLTRQSLEPVAAITNLAKKISHSSLNERIQVYHKEDELGQLSTVLNDLLERLQRAFETQTQFLSDVAHELKTPLSILRVHWESEINNPELPNKLKEKCVRDIETITRITHLINNLLLLSQTEEIQANFEMNPLQIDELINNVVEDAQILSEAKSQQLNIIDIKPVKIQGDRIRLYQLFFNLIDNAIRYTQEGGKIEVAFTPMDNHAVVEIRDNGAGISQEDLPHIFKRFYRVQKDRSRKTGGSGLGLSICKLIVQAHHGQIEVKSEIDKGSLFRVKFPIYRS